MFVAALWELAAERGPALLCPWSLCWGEDQSPCLPLKGIYWGQWKDIGIFEWEGLLVLVGVFFFFPYFKEIKLWKKKKISFFTSLPPPSFLPFFFHLLNSPFTTNQPICVDLEALFQRQLQVFKGCACWGRASQETTLVPDSPAHADIWSQQAHRISNIKK